MRVVDQVCNFCGQKKDSDEIIKHGICRACWHSADGGDDPAAKRRVKIGATYGLEYKDYVSMYSKQGGGCEICGTPIAKFKNDDGVLTAHVDHDHVTGEVRGLLCRNCNSGLGMFQDDTELLDAAIDYLLKSRG